MKKAFLAIAIVAMSNAAAIAQEEEAVIIKPKKLEHQLGFQMNELVRQVFNFNSAPANIDNPFMAIYSVNLAKSGWGLRAGAGYKHNLFSDDDGITKRDNDQTKYDVRLGVEKAFRLSSKWRAGAGIDGLYGKDDNKTNTIVRSNFDTATTKISSTSSSYGGGGMVWLRYHITDKILLGTEASLYYRTGKFNQTITITSKEFVGGGPNGGTNRTVTKTTKLDNDISEGMVRLPVVLYLLVRF